MSISTISEIGSDEILLETEEDRSLEVGTVAKKTHAIWGHFYEIIASPFLSITYVVRTAIGSVVRDLFIFPLKCSMLASLKMVTDQMAIEEAYARDFWDPTKPLDPNCKDQAKIREAFSPPEDRILPIALKNGKTVELTYRVMETKTKGDHFYNFVQIPGIYGTIHNNISGIHPYLSAYLSTVENASQLPPARFLIISYNNLNYSPETIDEAGAILLEILEKMEGQFGEINQAVAHSLGTILLSNALRHVQDPSKLPRNICFDRGPISSWEISKKYFWGFGRLCYFLAVLGGWAEDVEQNVVNFCRKWKARPSLVITGVEQDHYFSGSANLCLGNKIQQIDDIHVLVFNPPLQLAHEHAHHNLRPDFLNPLYLIGESSFMQSQENLTEALIRHSLS